MRKYQNLNLFSASDLVNFTGCRHCTFLDLKNIAAGHEKETDPQAQLLQKKGIEHEQAFLASLIASGLKVVEIPFNRSLDDRVSETTKAMHGGADVIYQGALVDTPWH
jgi:hypothetical protein